MVIAFYFDGNLKHYLSECMEMCFWVTDRECAHRFDSDEEALLEAKEVLPDGFFINDIKVDVAEGYMSTIAFPHDPDLTFVTMNRERFYISADRSKAHRFDTWGEAKTTSEILLAQIPEAEGRISVDMMET
ncbi:hypothetical protein C0584_00625 [Candidatus Parcubacteria bacterium]|nr:MAG: hypothetical protein C0584_00625 [Candidatus Parcubacteria bacterium]